MNSTLLNTKKVEELRVIAKELGLKGVSRFKKSDMIQAILDKASEQVEIVNNIAEVHKLAKDIETQEIPMWTKTKGEYDTCLVTRALTKLNATTPMTFAKDSRISSEDKVPVIAKNGKKALMTVSNIFKLSSKIKEEATMETTKQSDLSQEDLEMLNKIQKDKDEMKQRNEDRAEYFRIKREAEREEMKLQAEIDLEFKDLKGLEFFEKLVRLQNIAKYLQETRYERRFTRKFTPIEGASYDFSKALTTRVKNFKKVIKRNKFLKLTFTEAYNKDVNTLGEIIKISFDTQELASNENFEKNTEFVKLIDNVLIKTGVFDYKLKDSEINTPYEIADVLLAEQVDIAYNNKCAYHVRESAKNENNLRVPSKKQLDLIMNMVWKYRKVNGGASPKMPVTSLSQITSSVLATAILEKYAYYVDMKVDMPTLKQAELLFNRFVKWNVANSQMRNAFISKVMLELSFEQASQLIEVTYTDMWLITRYAKDNNLKIFEASFKVANMQKSTRSSAVQYYQQKEFRQRMSLYNLEDDK